MKRLRDIGTILFFIGWITAIILRYAVPEPSPAFLIAGGVAMLIGALMVISTGISRLIIGKVHLRPLVAIKLMPIFFVLYLAVWWFWQLAFPSGGRDLQFALLNAAALSVGLSLYISAYRKPA